MEQQTNLSVWERAWLLARTQLLKAPEMQVQRWRLDRSSQYGFTMHSTALRTPAFAILIEATPQSKWPSNADRPVNWKRFSASIPERRMPFFDRYPLSIFVKVNTEADRAIVVPMLEFSKVPPPVPYRNDLEHAFTCNEFRVLNAPTHVSYCDGESLSRVALRELCKLS